MPGLRSLLGQRTSPAGSESSGSGAPVVLIAGLGNPGPEYARHRHNIGFQVVDFSQSGTGWSSTSSRSEPGSRSGRSRWRTGGAGGWLLVKPMTYMNSSGEAVGPLAAFYKITPERVLVVHDDLDLPLGKLRLRANGSPGGQKGVASIIRALGTDSFGRLKIGISRPGGQNSGAAPAMDPSDYVLHAVLDRAGEGNVAGAGPGDGRDRGMAEPGH